MTARLDILKAAHLASEETQIALHALYMSDTSNTLVWEMFQAQVEKTDKLRDAVTDEIVSPTE